MADAAHAQITATLAPGVTHVPDDDALQNLHKIDHVVVLMMENRSFDHMLGFLKIEQGRADVDGPTAEMANTAGGHTYKVRAAHSTKLTKAQDPCHSSWCVDEQIADGCSGYVSNYLTTRKPALEGPPDVVMAYHTAEQLPVYDYLAGEFCVCDRWFCSVSGATLPNRCYAAAGTSAGTRDPLRPARPYNLVSFVRHLDAANASWRWYSHDYVPTLWLIDPLYGAAGELIPSYFDKGVFGHRSFVQRARDGDLPAVSWIDPNFIDLSFGPAGSNDDHPPSDLHAGQKLVLEAFDAVVRSPAWPKTLLVLTYDEHGGFFDHVEPPPAEDDYEELRRYGPRVPALVVAPFVGQGQVSSTVFDHTSIVKTILARFCRAPEGTVPDMGARVRAATHLGELLTEEAPRAAIPAADYQHLVDATHRWQEQLAHEAALAPVGLMAQPELTDWQHEFLAARQVVLAARQLPQGPAATGP